MHRAGGQLLAFSIPVWGWVSIVVLALLGLFINSWFHWRRSVRSRFRAHLQANVPGLEVVSESLTTLRIRLNDTESQFNLQGLFSRLVREKVRDESEEEKAVFDDVANTLKESISDLLLDPQRDRERIMARLQPPDFVNELQGKGSFPNRHIAELGLSVFYVVDSEHSVRYLDSDGQSQLGLSDQQLFDLAIENLRRITPRELIRDVFEKKAVIAVKSGDTMDAARILTIPGYLDEGEIVAACIPDRDTMFLVAASETTDWDSFVNIARNGDSRYRLLSRPVCVTSGGFELM